MATGDKGLYFGPKYLEHTVLSFVHFIENSQAKPRQHYPQVPDMIWRARKIPVVTQLRILVVEKIDSMTR